MTIIQRHDLDGCDADIIKLYLRTAENYLKRMGAASHSKSTLPILPLAHKLSGSSGFLGLHAMAQLSKELELAASQGKSKVVRTLLGRIRSEFAEIKHYRASSSARVMKSQTAPPPVVSTKRFKVFIVDDHPLLREGLTRLIQLQPELVLSGQASTPHEALNSIALLKPDIVILDLTLSGLNGLELIKDMKLRSLKSLILVLSMHDESLYAERALRAGAKGYIMKDEAPKDVLKAIHRVLKGEIYLSERMAAKMLHKVADGKSNDKSLPEGALSDRELQVFQSIGQGRGTRQIAEDLNISAKTVESYRAHIKIKMNLKNAHELTQHAVHWVESNHLN
jgi:DNA-binding NarL/FixJ family response regulator